MRYAGDLEISLRRAEMAWRVELAAMVVAVVAVAVAVVVLSVVVVPEEVGRDDACEVERGRVG